MKNVRKYKEQNLHIKHYATKKMPIPNLVNVNGKLDAVDEQNDYSKRLPLFIEALVDNTKIEHSSISSYNDILQYSFDCVSWNTLTSNIQSDDIIVNTGQRIYLRFNGVCEPGKRIGTIKCSKNYNVGGNILSLIDGKNYVNLTDISSYSNVFRSLFYSQSKLVDASELIFPNVDVIPSEGYYGMFSGCTSLKYAPKAIYGKQMSSKSCYEMFYNCSKLITAPKLPTTTLASNCYYSMFSGCASLTTAPELPATTLTDYCYANMFSNCTNLVNAPVLASTTLADYCYYYMFSKCTSLTTSPKLPATILADYCYCKMFNGCTSLVNPPKLPAQILVEQCYNGMFTGCTSLITAPEILATQLAHGVCLYMFQDCTSLVNAPELPATTLGNNCYERMFSNCTSLVNAPELPATKLVRECYMSMFSGCTSLVNAPELPATKLANECYKEMFRGCTSLTTAPELPATELYAACYNSMFYGCTSLEHSPELPTLSNTSGVPYENMFYNTNVLPDTSNIDFANPKHAKYLCCGLFAGTKVTDEDLFNILPINPDTGKYWLPIKEFTQATWYNSMFKDCKLLRTAPELPATTLYLRCYYGMFSGCTSLTTVPELPATTLAEECYRDMFYGCTSLTTAPELPATTLVKSCYSQMFYGCANLNYVKTLFLTEPSSSYTYKWLNNTANLGTFIKNIDATWDVYGEHGIPTNWQIQYNITVTNVKSLSITADDVNGSETTTTIRWMAICDALKENGEAIEITLNGSELSDEFPQNTSTTETVERTISFTYMGVTATTTITQGVWIDCDYTIDLNDNWQLSTTITNPDSTMYDGVYESFSNKSAPNSAAIMYIDITGYETFKLYIRSYAESSFDYVMVSQLDQDIVYNTSYSNTTLVKAHTRGKQNSGTTISNYTLVEFTGIDKGEHRITVLYRKDSSSDSGTDSGYVIIPKQ